MLQTIEESSLLIISKRDSRPVKVNAFHQSFETNASNNCTKNIFVCTFCQVFSPVCEEVVEHIISNHFELLPAGTKPENFVSKLQSLQENSCQKNKKIGRPRKIQSESKIEPKQPVIEPVAGPDGLFWCKKCLRHFSKPRQLTQHICIEDQDVSSNESSAESAEDCEFKKHSILEKVPWSRRKKRLKENLSDNPSTAEQDTINKSGEFLKKDVPHWKSDPSYVPLFQDESKKVAFEEHLKSIDYSYADGLYERLEKKCRNNHKTACGCIQSVKYSCNYCKKVSSSMSHIRLHCLIHTDIKPFTCPECPYRANSKGSLYMHMRKHTGNVFSCSHCNFTCIRRSHLIDHEETHSSASILCKLCKNTYKTSRSLISHIRKYHNNPGGKKLIKSLTSKQALELKCNICKKKFKSVEILNTHNKVCHENESIQNIEQHSPKDAQIAQNVDNNTLNNVEVNYPTDSSKNVQQPKDTLAEIVLTNFLQQKESHEIVYENVFQQAKENTLPLSNETLLEDLQVKQISDASVLEECQKTLDLDILNECLQSQDLQVLQSPSFSDECVQNFNLPSNMSRRHSLHSNSDSNPEIQHLQEMSIEKGEEIKPVEIKLFEKCKRAPAYVCCVCSAIYICPSTLKAHLKEHVNYTNLIEQSAEEFVSSKDSEAASDLDNVCEILQDSSEACSFDKELEKLYTSSLDMMWYLPEVSVVLQNNPAIFDHLLDDISNFPVTVNDSAQDLNKDADENMLKCFDEL